MAMADLDGFVNGVSHGVALNAGGDIGDDCDIGGGMMMLGVTDVR